MVHCHIPGHGQHECRFTHRGTGGNNHEVGRLPTGSHFIQSVEPGRNPTQSICTFTGNLDSLDRFINQSINSRCLFFYISLGNFEHLLLSHIHQVGHVCCLVVCLVLYIGTYPDQFPLDIFLHHDTGVELDMSCGCHLRSQLSQIVISPDLFQFPQTFHLLAHGKNIHRFVIQRKVLNSPVYLLMCLLIKTFRFQEVTHGNKRILLQHQRSQDSLLQIHGLRWHFPVFGL